MNNYRKLFSLLILLTFISCAHTKKVDSILGHEIVGNGPEKVIILHGWFSNIKTWNPVKPFLNKTKYTYIFADIRGYGSSRHIEGKYDENEIAKDIYKLANHLQVKRFHLVGHSMTGMATQRLALDSFVSKDNRVKSVIGVAVATAAAIPLDKGSRDFLKAAAGSAEVTSKAFGALTGNRYSKTWYDYKTKNNLESRPKEEVLLKYLDMFGGKGFASEVKKVRPKTPMLIIAGSHDLTAGKKSFYQKVMPGMFPKTEIKVIPSAGHYPMDETPVQLVALMESFLARNH